MVTGSVIVYIIVHIMMVRQAAIVIIIRALASLFAFLVRTSLLIFALVLFPFAMAATFFVGIWWSWNIDCGR